VLVAGLEMSYSMWYIEDQRQKFSASIEISNQLPKLLNHIDYFTQILT